MRLINTTTLQLEHFVANAPPYAILSHTWGDEEVSFDEIQTKDHSYLRTRKGYAKFEYTCTQTLTDELNYAWIDTCCINKDSSSELSEAINSMYERYSQAIVCYAFLSDVKMEEFESQFAESRWFTRGWTLQELLAPRVVHFYGASWKHLGSLESSIVNSGHGQQLLHEVDTKHTPDPPLEARISRITGIASPYLAGLKSVSRASVSERMSWAANRETTRPEDAAYCLLGIFDVNLPMLYGEGHKAFLRLQEEIMRMTDDQSLFAWGTWNSTSENEANQNPHWSLGRSGSFGYPLFASVPRDFQESGMVLSDTLRETPEPFSITNKGVRMTLPMKRVRGSWMAIINCRTRMNLTKSLAVMLRPLDEGNGIFCRSNPLLYNVESDFENHEFSARTFLFCSRASQITYRTRWDLQRSLRESMPREETATRHLFLLRRVTPNVTIVRVKRRDMVYGFLEDDAETFFDHRLIVSRASYRELRAHPPIFNLTLYFRRENQEGRQVHCLILGLRNLQDPIVAFSRPEPGQQPSNWYGTEGGLWSIQSGLRASAFPTQLQQYETSGEVLVTPVDIEEAPENRVGY